MPATIAIDNIYSREFMDYLSETIGVRCREYARQPQQTFGRENENYFLSIGSTAVPVEVVLRCKPNFVTPSREGYDQDYIRKEYLLLEELQRIDIGYRTPKVWGFRSGGLLDTEYYLMEKLTGTPLYWNFLPHYSATLIRNYAKAVSALSQISLSLSQTLTELLPKFSLAHSFQLIEEKAMRKHRQDPLRPYALAWLKEHFPLTSKQVIRHGDLNPSNILTEDDRITGIVDWENAHISDEPLGEITHVGWIYDRAELIDVFCEAFGRSREELKWHLVLWYFGNTFNDNDIGIWETYNRDRLAVELGYLCASGYRSYEYWASWPYEK